MDVKFGADVAAVGGYGVGRDMEFVGDLFVGQPFRDVVDDFLLAFAESRTLFDVMC